MLRVGRHYKIAYVTRSRPMADLWLVLAFGAALVLAAVVLVYSARVNGALPPPLATAARLSFLLLWAAYTGSALMAVNSLPIPSPFRFEARPLFG